MAQSSTQILLALTHGPSADLLEDRLRRKDAQVIRIENGEEARKQIQEEPIKVVVAQTNLPGRTGLELLRRFPPLHPPFVLMGRRGNDAEVIRAFEMGAFDYFTRPFAPNIVTARILRIPRLLEASH